MDSHEFYEMYRGDKDFRLGIELCRDPDNRYSAMVPDLASPADRTFFHTDRFPRNQLPKLPDNFKVHYMKSRLVYFSKGNLSLGGFFQFSGAYPSLIKRLKPDLIFENPYTTLTPRSYLTYFAAWGNRIPMVYVDPGDIPPKGAVKNVLARLERPIIKNARHIIVYNEMGKERFTREYGFPVENISVVPKPVDVTKFIPGKGREENRIKLNVGDRFVVAYIGRLSNNKGAAHLLKAANIIKEAGLAERYFFIFAGGNIIKKDADDIRAMNEKFGLDNVHFTGHVTNSEIAGYQAAADLIVYPDVTNLPGFSSVLAESMAMGKAILIGIKGFEMATPLTHMHDSIIISARDADAIAENIQMLEADIILREKLEENARKYAEERMSWNVQVKIYKEIFQRAIER